LLLSTIACGGKDIPVAPTPTPAGTTFTLSGMVTSTTGTAINGATVRINDGALRQFAVARRQIVRRH